MKISKSRKSILSYALAFVMVFSVLSSLFILNGDKANAQDASPTGSITITKYENLKTVAKEGTGIDDAFIATELANNNITPLAGVIYEYRRIADYGNDGLTTMVDPKPDWTEATATDAEGKVVLENLRIGVYEIREKSGPAATPETATTGSEQHIVDPTIYTISIPLMDKDGNKVLNEAGEEILDVKLFPKNPKITSEKKEGKTNTELQVYQENDPMQVMVGEPYFYAIDVPVPPNINAMIQDTQLDEVTGLTTNVGQPRNLYTQLVFEDTLDEKVDYYRTEAASSIKVIILRGTERIELKSDATPAEFVVNSEPGLLPDANNSKEIKLTVPVAGIAKLLPGDVIRYEFQAKLNAKAIENGAILTAPNKAKVTITNHPKNGEATDIPTNTNITYTKPNTGDLELLKISSNKTAANAEIPLAGAKFQLYATLDLTNGTDAVSEANKTAAIAQAIKDGYIKVDTDVVEDIGLSVANPKIGFYKVGEEQTTPDGTADGTTKGKIKWSSLPEGQYYIVETVAPAGYNKLIAPISVTIKADETTGAFTTKEIKAINIPVGEIPPTGGIGTVIFVVVGIVLMGVAIHFLTSSKKKEQADQTK